MLVNVLCFRCFRFPLLAFRFLLLFVSCFPLLSVPYVAHVSARLLRVYFIYYLLVSSIYLFNFFYYYLLLFIIIYYYLLLFIIIYYLYFNISTIVLILLTIESKAQHRGTAFIKY